MPRRLLLSALAAAAALCLSGCTLAGTVTILDDGVGVDVVVSHPERTHQALADGSFMTDGVDVCGEWELAGLHKEQRPTTDGIVSCRFTGEAREDELMGGLVQSRDHDFIHVDRSWLGGETLKGLDLTVVFAGEVLAVSDGGQVEGHTVRWTDPAALNGVGLAATARRDGQGSLDVPPALLGLGAGALVASAGWWLAGRRRTAAQPAEFATVPDPEPHPEAEDVRPTDAVRTPEPPEDPSVWAPPPD